MHVAQAARGAGRGLVRVDGRRLPQQVPHQVHEPAALDQRGGLARTPAIHPAETAIPASSRQQHRRPADGDVVAAGQVRGLRVRLRPEAGPRPHVRGQLALGDRPAARAAPSPAPRAR